MTLRQRQERAARRAARIAAMHEAIRQAAAHNEPQHEERNRVMKKHEIKLGCEYIAKVSGKLAQVRITGESRYGGWDATNLVTKKVVRIKSAQRLRAEAGRKAAGATHVAAGGEATNPLEAHYRTQKDVAKTEKAAKVAAYRKEVAEKLAQPDPKLDAAVKAAEEGRQAKKAKAAKPKGERKGGVLDAAVKVLHAAGKPMNCQDVVKEALAKGLWQTKGATPAATCYAAIIREIAAKGKDARFRKTDRGQFEAVAARQ